MEFLNVIIRRLDELISVADEIDLQTDNLDLDLDELNMNTNNIEQLLTQIRDLAGTYDDGVTLQALLETIRDTLQTIRDQLGDPSDDSDTLETLLEAINSNVDGLEGLVKDKDVQSSTGSTTGSDLAFATSISADHEINEIMFTRDSTEEIDIEIGIRDTTGPVDFVMVKETGSAVDDIIITDFFEQTENEEIYVETTGVTTGDVHARVSYKVND